MIWLSSTTVSPLLGSAVELLTSGLRGLLSTVSSLFKRTDSNTSIANKQPEQSQSPQLPQQQSTEPKFASAPLRIPSLSTDCGLSDSATNSPKISPTQAEFPLSQKSSTASDANSIQTILKGYLQNLSLPKLDLQTIQGELENLLTNSELMSFAGKTLLGKVDRSSIVNAIQSRTDFSPQDIHQIVDLVEGVWQKVFGQSQQPNEALIEFLESADPIHLTSEELDSRLHQVAESNSSQPADFGSFTRAVLKRADLPEADADRILSQIQLFQNRIAAPSDGNDEQSSDHPINIIQLDVENYLRTAHLWQLKRKTTQSEFREVIYDPDADPELVRQQLERLNRDYFEDVLKQRNDLKPEKITRIANQLDDVRQSLLADIKTAIAQQRERSFHDRLASYIHTAQKMI